MQSLTRSAFEATLKQLGYAELEPFEYESCRHPDRPQCALYTMPTADCRDGAATYGDLGWCVFEGCEACVMEVGSVLFCGGLYEHLRIFRGEQDITDTTTSVARRELQPADAPLE
jgi:hypothetical protein